MLMTSWLRLLAKRLSFVRHFGGRRPKRRQRPAGLRGMSNLEVLEHRVLLSAPHPVDLSTLDGTNGFRIKGISGYSGTSVSSAGDFNGDGMDDLIIGAPGAGSMNRWSSGGESYVVFGFRTAPPLRPISGTGGRDELVGTSEDDAFHPGGGFDFITTGFGSDTIRFDDLIGSRDVLTIADFNPLNDTLDLQGATLAQTLESAQQTVLLLDGADRDTIVLLGVTDSPFDSIA